MASLSERCDSFGSFRSKSLSFLSALGPSMMYSSAIYDTAPVAIGAKRARPDRKVVAVAGDGGFIRPQLLCRVPQGAAVLCVWKVDNRGRFSAITPHKRPSAGDGASLSANDVADVFADKDWRRPWAPSMARRRAPGAAETDAIDPPIGSDDLLMSLPGTTARYVSRDEVLDATEEEKAHFPEEFLNDPVRVNVGSDALTANHRVTQHVHVMEQVPKKKNSY